MFAEKKKSGPDTLVEVLPKSAILAFLWTDVTQYEGYGGFVEKMHQKAGFVEDQRRMRTLVTLIPSTRGR